MPQILLIIVFYGILNFPLGTDWVNYISPPETQLQVNADQKADFGISQMLETKRSKHVTTLLQVKSGQTKTCLRILCFFYLTFKTPSPLGQRGQKISQFNWRLN